MSRVLVALLIAACGGAQPAARPPPAAIHNEAPPAPAPTVGSDDPTGWWCWISDPRASGCHRDHAECKQNADEMRSYEGVTSVAECALQDKVTCYKIGSDQLCYASRDDCADGRERMSEGNPGECTEVR
jgi:hypothetical protein